MDYLDKLKEVNIVVPGIRDIYTRLAQALLEPGADPAATVLAASTLIILFAILVVLVMYFFLRRRENLKLAQERREFEEAMIAKNPANAEFLMQARRQSPKFLFGSSLLVAIILLSGANFATEQDLLCVSCHSSSPHQKLKDTQIHGKNSCVSCHEPSGFAKRIVVTMPARWNHVLHYSQSVQSARPEILGLEDPLIVADEAQDLTASAKGNYGAVTTSACLGCHEKIKTEISTNKSTGITMQHKQPLNAGSKCFDCHALSTTSGLIIMDKGMDPCLKCHNDKRASTSCSTCHTKDYASAAASRAMVGERKPLVATYDCYGCHKPAGCDSCHGGIRLPHTQEFMTTGLHAYEGAKSLWKGSSGQCIPCHNKERRTCNKPGCHGSLPYHFAIDKAFKANHPDGRWGTQGGSSMSCNDCHQVLDKEKGDACAGCHRNKGAR